MALVVVKLGDQSAGDLLYLTQVAGAIARAPVAEGSVLRGAMYYAADWATKQEYTVGKVSTWTTGVNLPARRIPGGVPTALESREVRLKVPSFIRDGLQDGLDQLVDVPPNKVPRAGAAASIMIAFGLSEMNRRYAHDPEYVRRYWRSHFDEEASMGIYADERRRVWRAA